METAENDGIQILGGTAVRKVKVDQLGQVDYALNPYVYYYYRAQAQEQIELEGLSSYTVHVFDCENSSVVYLPAINNHLNPGDVVHVENSALDIDIDGGEAILLIAGVKEKIKEHPSITVTYANDIKKVTKPWGHELWLNGEHPGYAFKRIFIKSGFKTSLQYHNYKSETNVLMRGQVKSYYKNDEDIPNDEVTEKDLSYVTLNPISILDVFPGRLHRLESITDITLCEVSTPHLDDVIRVLDDAKRGNGRIEEEHN